MKHKFFGVPIILLALAIGYLSIAYPLIYYRIGKGNLPFLDVNPMYKFNEQTNNQKFTYVAMGDSLTYGEGASDFSGSYPYILAQKLAIGDREVKLFPLAFPGYKAKDLLGNYTNTAVAAKPELITIMIGVNDMHDRVSLSEFSAEYQSIIDSLKSGTKAKIYLISIPYIGDSSLFTFPYQNYFREQTEKFNQEIKVLAEKNQVEFIDITHPTEDIFKNPGNHYSQDHFHPSSEGYKLFAQLIYGSLSK